MPPRKKKTRRRRDTSVKLLNVLEAYTYSAILSQGILGTSPWGFITGVQDLEQVTLTNPMWGEEPSFWSNPDQAVSLKDLGANPGQALQIMANSFRANITDMAIQGFFVGISFKFGRKLLRRQINTVNRAMKPLGLGVKL